MRKQVVLLSFLFCLTMIPLKGFPETEGKLTFSEAIGSNGSIHELLEFRGELIIAGNFESFNGIEGLNNIARWDGQVLRSLGEGLDGTVISLSVFRDRLIVGGKFAHSGAKELTNIASWDGMEWRPIGRGFGNTVANSIVILNEERGEAQLVITSQLEDSREYQVFSWTEEKWLPMGEPFDDHIYDLIVYDGDLVLSGLFRENGANEILKVARWNGEWWEGLGAGLNDSVWDLTVFNGDLIAAGNFTATGKKFQRKESDRDIRYVARWNGRTWNALSREGSPQQLNDRVMKVESIDGRLIVGGWFTKVGGHWETDDSEDVYKGGISSGQAVYWTDETQGWSLFQNQFSGTPYAIQAFESRIYVGGFDRHSRFAKLQVAAE